MEKHHHIGKVRLSWEFFLDTIGTPIIEFNHREGTVELRKKISWEDLRARFLFPEDTELKHFGWDILIPGVILLTLTSDTLPAVPMGTTFIPSYSIRYQQIDGVSEFDKWIEVDYD